MRHPRGWHDDTSGYSPGLIIGGKYLLVEPLGVGGMGQVWTAQNLATGAEVAVKLLLASRARCEGVLERFRLEAHATAQLAHRGIIRIFDLVELPEGAAGNTEGALWSAGPSIALVMERLHGNTLADHLEHHAPLTVEETLAVIVPVLAALQHAHGAGIIHRDLKPENIFLSIEPDGAMIPKLLDFGVSKMTRSSTRPVTGAGLVVGTPGHMSPEQVRGLEVDSRSDIFCVGILLYMCLTGKNPYVGLDDAASMRAVFGLTPAKPPQVSSALWECIASALSRDPDLRFASASEMATALSKSQRPSRASIPEDERESVVGYSWHAPLTTRAPAGFRERVGKLAGLFGMATAAVIGVASVATLHTPAQRTAAAAAIGRLVHPSVNGGVHEIHAIIETRDSLAASSPAVSEAAPLPVATSQPAPPSFAAVVANARAMARARESKNKVVLRDPGF